MPGRRTALIIATDDYEQAGLRRLNAPAADARALERVLGDPDIGGFEVQVVLNEPAHTTQGIIEDLFSESRFDDVLLLHFSCHGLKNESGELYFAARNTRPDRLGSTAIAADFVQRCIKSCRARSVVLFLDCCYGGAYGEGVAVRAAGSAGVLDAFPAGKLGGGRGRAVISASSAMEYAFEGSDLVDTHERPSIFTSAVVQGLESGEADRDEDGLVSLDELYDYVFDKVRADSPSQTPTRDVEMQGDLYLARSNRKRITASPIPADVAAALADSNMYARIGAVAELGNRLASPDPGISLGAREALERVAREDITYVADTARAALAALSAPPAEPATAPVEPATAPEPAITPVTVSGPAEAGTARSLPADADRAASPGVESAQAAVTTTARDQAVHRRVGLVGASCIVGSIITATSILLPYQWSDSMWAKAPFRVGFLVALSSLGLAAGALTLSNRAAARTGRQFWLGPGLLMGVALASSWGLTVAVEVSLLEDGQGFGTGFQLTIIGHLWLMATGVLAVALVFRGQGVTAQLPDSRDRIGIAIAVIGVIAGLVLQPYIAAGWGDDSPLGFETVWQALLTVAVCAVVLILRPHHVGSSLALGWAVSGLAIVIDNIAYSFGQGNDAGLFAPFGLCLIVIGVLAVVRMLAAPPSPRVDVSARHP